MMKSIIPIFTLFLLVFASCQKEELETELQQTSENQAVPNGSITTRSAEVPFHLYHKTKVEVIGEENGVLTLDIQGAGKATHLGKSTSHSISSVNTTVFPWLQSGGIEIVAANGQKLFGNYSGIAIPSPEGVSYEGTWEISGGTGNYAGVTGSGNYEGSAVFTSPTSSIGDMTFDGTLSGL